MGNGADGRKAKAARKKGPEEAAPDRGTADDQRRWNAWFRTALEAGTEEHYLDAELYDHEYRRRREDLGYYRRLVKSERATDVLELGCGTGRLMLPLLRDGARVTGMDLSQPMLRRCRELLLKLPPSARARGQLVRADFRQFSLGRRFPLILCPFNAMQHLYTRSDVERFLGCVREHLTPTGTFAFDVLNPDLEWLTRDPERRWSRTRFVDPRTGGVYHYSTNHSYDSATQINLIRLYYDREAAEEIGRSAGGPGDLSSSVRSRRGEISPSGRAGSTARPARGAAKKTASATGNATPSKVVHLAQRQFFPEELIGLLEYNGLTVEGRDGDFLGGAFDGGADSQVCRCSIRSRPRR